jgi:hypothetical protein
MITSSECIKVLTNKFSKKGFRVLYCMESLQEVEINFISKNKMVLVKVSLNQHRLVKNIYIKEV